MTYLKDRAKSEEPELQDASHPILVKDLTKRFGDFCAVDHISFTVSPGEVFGWLGPNGAGKTTTIRMLLGLLKPTEGQSFVLGYNSATQTKAMQAASATCRSCLPCTTT